jgi:SAM-dependent methyltransferase
MKKFNDIKLKSWDPIWDEVFSGQEWGKYPSENLIQFIARNFYKAKRDDIRILEVGCGTGANLWYISREGFQAYGVDGSAVAISQANERMKNENLSVTLQVADIVNLPFENNFFDAVIDNECIYSNNNENSQLIYNEIHRVLKPNAKFYSRTFSDKMFIGENANEVGELEYTDIKSGPFKDKGFVRLSSKDSINATYGKFFEIQTIDYLESTNNNESLLINEWIVICTK